MPRHETVVIDLVGATSAALTPINLGAMPSAVGGYVVAAQASTLTLTGVVAPNEMQLWLGGGAPGPLLGRWYAPPTMLGALGAHTIVLPLVGIPGFPGGIPVTAATQNVWFQSRDTVQVRTTITLTIWRI